MESDKRVSKVLQGTVLLLIASSPYEVLGYGMLKCEL